MYLPGDYEFDGLRCDEKGSRSKLHGVGLGTGVKGGGGVVTACTSHKYLTGSIGLGQLLKVLKDCAPMFTELYFVAIKIKMKRLLLKIDCLRAHSYSCGVNIPFA